MAYKLEIERTNNTPYVLIDEEKGYIRLEGECYLEDILSFFTEINDWLIKYLPDPTTPLTFDCALEYFNSSTTKLLYNILYAMDRAASDGKKVVVNWIAAKGDQMIIECGEDFREEVEHLEFNMTET